MRQIRDYYFKKAKQEGYAARSAYKLIEAQKKFRFIKKGSKILELGASPGAWTKFCSLEIGKNGIIVAVDIKPMKFDNYNVNFILKDANELSYDELLSEYGRFNCLLSDMAPNTTGRKDVDHYRSIGLAQIAMDMAGHLLTPSGAVFLKVFQGPDLNDFRKNAIAIFKKVRVFKPKSSRPESVEIFFYMEGLRC